MAQSLYGVPLDSGSTYITSLSGTIPAAAAGSNLLVFLATSCPHDNLVSVTDNTGNTWVRLTTPLSNGNSTSQFWYCGNVKAGTTTMTFTGNTVDYVLWNAIVMAWSGLAPTNPVDQVATNVESAFATNHFAGPTQATTNASDTVFNAYCGVVPTTYNTTGTTLIASDNIIPYLMTAVAAVTTTTTGPQNVSGTTGAGGTVYNQGVVYCLALKPAGATPVPAAPTNLTATTSPTQITIGWTPGSGGGAVTNGFDVYRSTTSGNQGLYIGGTANTGTSYTDSTVTAGTTYYYTVIALNASGLTSSAQLTATAQTVAPIVPVAPTNLTGTAGNTTTALSWTDAPTQTSNKVYRSTAVGTRGTQVNIPVLQASGQWRAAPKLLGSATIVGAGGGGGLNLPGWTLVANEDWTTQVAEPNWFSIYSNSTRTLPWEAYGSDPNNIFLTTEAQSSGSGNHYDVRNMSVLSGITGATGSGNVLRMNLRRDSSDGKAWGCAPAPRFANNKTSPAQTYGRYEYRLKVLTAVAGWHIAWLLWPKTDDAGTLLWPQAGETDYPENGLDENIAAYHHWYGGTSGSSQDPYQTQIPFTQWNVCVIEWKPSSCEYFLNGTSIGHTTGSHVVPNPMRVLLQTETAGNITQGVAQGVVYCDYVRIWSYP